MLVGFQYDGGANLNEIGWKRWNMDDDTGLLEPTKLAVTFGHAETHVVTFTTGAQDPP